MTRYIFLAATLFAASFASAQQEGPTTTQALIALESKTPATPTTSNITIKVNNKSEPLVSIVPVQPNGAQVAILIDDGLRTSFGRQLDDLRDFITNLPAGMEVFVGYMQNGRVVSDHGFTTDRAAAVSALRLSIGSAGASSSPYFCLSDFTKRWPGSAETSASESGQSTPRARFILMITNGVDPYNGSTSITNQDSPYVSASIRDAQRIGAAVYSIYYTNAGIGGNRASFSGQSYLAQVAGATGGRSFFQGSGNPVAIAPFLKEFQSAIAETYIATFNAPGNKDFVQLKASTTLPKAKLRAPEQIRPGTRIAAQP
jgi:hypothetical protein